MDRMFPLAKKVQKTQEVGLKNERSMLDYTLFNPQPTKERNWVK